MCNTGVCGTGVSDFDERYALGLGTRFRENRKIDMIFFPFEVDKERVHKSDIGDESCLQSRLDTLVQRSPKSKNTL